ncbi:MAG: hypothetical protein ACRC1K_15130, partial [Planctomycetia bacterium]
MERLPYLLLALAAVASAGCFGWLVSRQWRRRRFDMPAPTYSALLTAAVFLGAVFTVPDAAAWPAALLGTAL